MTALALLCAAVSANGVARASQAYGTINNFDAVNDTGVECHGFEIELDDCHSADISYTYDYNHYGTPKLTEFTSSDATGWHTNVFVDYEAVWTNTGYGFANWTDNGRVVSTAASYTFTNLVNRSLVANFGPGLMYWPTQPNTLAIAWLTNFSGCLLQQNSDLRGTNWTSLSNAVNVVGSNYQATISTTNGTRFFRLKQP